MSLSFPPARDSMSADQESSNSREHIESKGFPMETIDRLSGETDKEISVQGLLRADDRA